VTGRWLSTGSSVLLVAAAALAHAPVANAGAGTVRAHHQFALAAGATVLTLEGGIVGLQHLLHFTPLQLRGDLCDAPNVCQPVDYFAMPLGQYFNDQGAVTLNAAIDALPDDGAPVILYGHSQGGQVIYSALRGWAADPSNAPDPALVSWVSIGNPENTFGGRDPDPIPADSPYQGTEVIRQYDGWADWPTDQSNLLAVLNAVIGMGNVHASYFDVDVDDPANLRHVEGNVTYVFVPNPMLPLIQATGLLAPLLNPVLDPILRPIVESGYQRPVGFNPGAAAPAPAANGAAAQTVAARSVVARDRVAGAGAVSRELEPVGVLESAAAADPDAPGSADLDRNRGPAERRAAVAAAVSAAPGSAGRSGSSRANDPVAGTRSGRR